MARALLVPLPGRPAFLSAPLAPINDQPSTETSCPWKANATSSGTHPLHPTCLRLAVRHTCTLNYIHALHKPYFNPHRSHCMHCPTRSRIGGTTSSSSRSVERFGNGVQDLVMGRFALTVLITRAAGLRVKRFVCLGAKIVHIYLIMDDPALIGPVSILRMSRPCKRRACSYVSVRGNHEPTNLSMPQRLMVAGTGLGCVRGLRLGDVTPVEEHDGRS